MFLESNVYWMFPKHEYYFTISLAESACDKKHIFVIFRRIRVGFLKIQESVNGGVSFFSKKNIYFPEILEI